MRIYPNVIAVSAGKYIVSSATFPTYFTRETDQVVAQTRLDIKIFAAQIARRLDIAARYIGEEPYCPVTNAYNEAMLEIFPQHGIEIVVMERIQMSDEIISASKVREMIRQDDWEGIKEAVPESTFTYLRSPEAKEVLEKIRGSVSRH